MQRLLGGLTWRELARRVAHECAEDDLPGRSAQLSYYFLLAIFPCFIILATVLGFMAQTGSDIFTALLQYVARMAPPSAYQLVLKTVTEIRTGASGGKFSVGIIGTLWAASMGVGAIMDALNKAYEIREGRPWWKAQLVAIGLTIVLGCFVTAALVTILYGSEIGLLLTRDIGLQAVWVTVSAVARWPLAIVVAFVAFMIIYKYAPDLDREQWKRTIPGAAVATVLWLGISLGLRLYLHFFNSYGATYGSLGALIVLLLWFYLSGAALLVGGEVNSEIENAAAKAGEADAHRAGEKRAPAHAVSR